MKKRSHLHTGVVYLAVPGTPLLLDDGGIALLGLFHCFWHAPLSLTDEWDTARQDPSQYLAYLVLVVSMSFVQSWLVNGSRGSVLLVILGHNGINWSLFTVGTLTGYEVTTNWPAALGSRSSPSSRPEADSAINSRKRKA